MPPEGTPESNEPEQSGDNTVDVHQASIEDLDAALANAKAVEDPGQGDGAVPAQPETPPSEQPQQPEGQPNPEAPASGEGVAAPGADPSKPAESAKRTYTPEEIQGIVAENGRLKQGVNQKELFIQHRSTELGQVRSKLAETKRQLAEARARLSTGLEDRWRDEPVQAHKDQAQIQEIDNQITALDGQEERATKIVEAQTFFLRHVDTDKVSLDDVAEVLRADGIGEQYVAQFKANPFEWTTPEALVQFGKRAMDKKAFVEADKDRRVLAKHVLRLNDELAKAKARPGQVITQVQKHLNASPSVTAANGSSSPRKPVDLDPTRMTTQELDRALAQAMRH